ncbi:hypothetical protein C8J56DRAFT_1053326 [Mycena floridula]|nr:hypothetical protein C8J56DRAFT_1053326 [Mycena floridula]
MPVFDLNTLSPHTASVATNGTTVTTTFIIMVRRHVEHDPRAVLFLFFFLLLCFCMFATEPSSDEEADPEDLSHKVRILKRINEMKLLKEARETSLEVLEKRLAGNETSESQN